jgi:hypothetical protein
MKRKTSRKAKSARSKRSAKRAPKRRGAAKTQRADAVDAIVAAAAETLRLTIDPTWHRSVAFNLRLILRFGALVDEFELPDDAEPAPVFHA